MGRLTRPAAENATAQSEFFLRKDSLRLRAIAVRHVFVFLVLGVVIHAQTGYDYLAETPERIIGLLDLPAIVAGGCGPAPKRATTRAFSAPSQNGVAVGTIYWQEVADTFCGLMIDRTGGITEEIPTLESGYEIPAAIIFERRGAWFRIRLKTGSAWVQHATQADFLPYPDMLREYLAHTLQGWDGALRATPGPSGKLTPLPSGWKALLDRQLSVDYLGSRRIGNGLWVHIRFAAKSSCDFTYKGVTDVDGWIPAYQANGSPALWFASRGC